MDDGEVWSVGSRFIVSHSVLSDETYTGGLRDLLSPFRPGSLFILDEAHHKFPRQLVLPLEEHRRWGGHDDHVDTPP